MNLRSVAVAVAALLLLSGCAAPGAVTTRDAPPWPRPTDLTARAESAGLRNVWGERLAEHVHTHLTILDGDEPVTVPANIGHSDDRKFAAEIHTHNTSGIVHVESPTEQTFTLGQFFDEWGVSLGPEHVGGLRGELTVWVDGHRRIGNPRSIELTDLRQVVLVVTTVGEVPHLPAPFDWPPQYD
ncbi:hypothetical protein K0028_03375 [Curtobacterium flaccumfaciens pv. flaccumfaciens]|uniref:hypothetical protein n=1 Tax=Curtobacterium flaccumfaciens TaxID=2035 RepID=UPI0021B0A138|nr:hypothetical protein [Curtobacterium flaccumfaciens]QYI97997.1 hypothetical protein K0028_03375 [Curtobacterium flaccumfaciens pv. flaccumfaciens]UXN22190.1 hypothetical protein N8D77_01135 [Curtobacterium flaccumfaciens pv. flaccumfaciens]